jgi:putative restriction endonuclease
MRAFVAVTDGDWYRFLHSRPHLDEVNFWQPSGRKAFATVNPGEPFLFKLHFPHNAIVGGGTFLYSSLFPFSIAWEAFGERNGAASQEEMRLRIERYRRQQDPSKKDYIVGCVIVREPFFLDEKVWIPTPADWSPNIVTGKTYDLDSPVGDELWQSVLSRSPFTTSESEAMKTVQVGKPYLTYPRLGQGSFRLAVMDAYGRRCAVTREKALPVLQAAHIRPVEKGGLYEISNGLLLRSDVHTLFDRGYVTITPKHQLIVSKRLRDEFDNGEEYLRLSKSDLLIPASETKQPSTQHLEWHNDEVFLK